MLFDMLVRPQSGRFKLRLLGSGRSLWELTVIKSEPPRSEQASFGPRRVKENMNNGNQIRGRLHADAFASMPNLFQHGIFRVIAVASFDAAQIQIEHASMGENAHVVVSERKDDAKSPFVGEVAVGPELMGRDQSRQRS